MPAGDNVMAVDVAIDDSGLRWTYQRQGTGEMSDSAYLDNVAARACETPEVRDIAANGFRVTYDLIDTAGVRVGSRTIDRCQ